MTTARIAPAVAPFAPEIQGWLERTMPPGVPPLVLFTTLARDARLAGRFFAGGLLDRGHLTLRQREIVILRTTARCGSEYEWGVHAAFFAERCALGAAQLAALAHDAADSPGWAAWAGDERALVALCDALHAQCTLDDATWQAVRRHFGEEAVLELLLLAGFYRTVSLLTNSLKLPLEPFARRFPAAP